MEALSKNSCTPNRP